MNLRWKGERGGQYCELNGVLWALMGGGDSGDENDDVMC